MCEGRLVFQAKTKADIIILAAVKTYVKKFEPFRAD